jgi:hypothetical protein
MRHQDAIQGAPEKFMPAYVPYRDDIETIDPDEEETQAKIIEVMIKGQNYTREKYGKAVRVSHAKAHALLKGELIVRDHLPPELAQGLFARGGTYPVVVRLAQVPGELVDDSKVSTPRGMSIKVFNVAGPKLAPFTDITTQDFVFDTGKEFIAGGAKAFLQAFKPNALLAPKLSDDVKGAVSSVALATNKILATFGLSSGKLDFFGHPHLHPLAEPYFSQTAHRYGDYVAKFGVVAGSPVLEALAFEAKTYDALREACLSYFKSNAAEFDFVVQLNTDLDKMPIEDATAPWPEEESPYRPVARLVLPVQTAFDSARHDVVDGNLSFSPAHTLAAHRPLGSINRARLAAYTALATLRRQENDRPTAEPASIDEIPD